ncbi:hypothetical protein ADK59_35320 [Streptomyces sp. XY332]|nr:hypothetical protein ADK59_35320 [Streptomyces sp. XY332]
MSIIRASLRGEARLRHARPWLMYVQEVRAAREAEGLDLLEEVQEGGGEVLGPAFAQLLGVGVEKLARCLGTRSIHSG